MAMAGRKLLSRRSTAPLLQRIRNYAAAEAVAIPEQKGQLALKRPLPKVQDRLVSITVIDEDGDRRKINGLSGQTLFKTLANNGYRLHISHPLDDIYACSAEVCQVSIANEWLEKLPPRSEDEVEVLQRATRKEVDFHSRCGCQIVLQPELNGMVVALAEEQPWDIP